MKECTGTGSKMEIEHNAVLAVCEKVFARERKDVGRTSGNCEFYEVILFQLQHNRICYGCVCGK